MHDDITAGRDPALLRGAAVIGAWIGNVQSEVKTAAAIPGINRIVSFRRPSISFPRFLPLGSPTQRNRGGLDDGGSAQKGESARGFVNSDEIGLTVARHRLRNPAPKLQEIPTCQTNTNDKQHSQKCRRRLAQE